MMRRALIAVAVVAVLALGGAVPAHAETTLPVLTGPVRIMIAGDSTADGYPVACPNGGGDYGDRYALGDWLTLVAALPVSFVGSQVSGTCHPAYSHHEGYSNKTVTWLADNIGALLAANPADILIVRTGVNDAKAPLYRTPVQIEADYVRLIDNARLQNPAIRILASQIIPPNGSQSAEYARASVTAQQFNRDLPALTAAYGDAVHIAANALVTTTYLADGLHPSSTGYFMLAWIAVHDPRPGYGLTSWLSATPLPATDSGPIVMNPWG